MAGKTKTKQTAMAVRQAASTARDRVVIMGRAAAPIARRVGTAAVKAAADEKHTLTALGAVGVVSYLEKNGQLESLPDPLSLGPVATLGLASWLVGKYSRNRMAEHAATGLLSVALNKYITNG